MMSNNSFKDQLRNTPVLQGPFPDLDFDAFPDTPHDAFKLWFHNAVAAGVREPHAMTLSTVDADGAPDARVLILKHVDSRGWHFAIKADSPKGIQLSCNQHAALTFYWPQLARQIRVRGRATALPADESAQDYQARPLAARVTAAASQQSRPLANREVLGHRRAQTAAAMMDDPLLGVEAWRVYAVTPRVVEFWQGDASRLHHRLEYVHGEDGNAWQKRLLWP
ncbi:hypothetical protein ASPZODRAFT_137380 [Penicilliopsis zonata CBS 506.65]|uniref:pyridoxal 5'-phosphate synthase n=1 Tax=Penicilliopsis zonata CBS 506.65 TaxID=1073090 RepID=A0A1L9S583_9EURO|nr:hypothetical protein ASPZODRAFT_137380 [Penicilliopsis zonata CBS 506.65]OJJ42297.1 hypothetical protein ASPZODRAFT_137380 [Penicilliopsis zonata CBS 506.65]